MICENFFNMRHLGRIAKLRKNEYGFSLIELLVVIGIIGILVAISFPNLLTSADDYRLKAAARDIYSDMQKARLQAIKGNTLVCLSFTTVVYPAKGGGYTVFIDDGAGGGVANNGSQDGGELTLNTVTMSRQNSLVNAAFGFASRITYTAKGVTAGSQTGNVTIRNNNRWYKITVSAGGGLRLEVSKDGITWI